MDDMEGKMKGSKDMSKKLGVVILAIVVAIAFVPLISAQLQMADSFGVDDASGVEGTNVLVPVNITNVTNGPIQTLCFDVIYDHGVIDLVALQAGDLTPTWMHTLGSNHESITITTFESANAIPNGSTGSVVLLNFSVIGDPYETSPMSMDSIDFSNTNLQHGTAPANNGTFEVLPIPMADEFGVNNASGAQGTNVLVPVDIINTKNGPIQTMCFDILYNHSIIDLVDLEEGNLTPVAGGWMHTLGLNHESITITTFESANAIPNGSTNSVVFLNFSVIGEPGTNSSMNISNIDFSNTALKHGTAQPRNGIFEVPLHGWIWGTITYINGTAISGAIVNLTQNGILTDSTTTDENGNYTFEEKEPGEYNVTISKAHFWDNSTTAIVYPGEGTEVNIELLLKGDLDHNCKVADAVDVTMMIQASVGDIPSNYEFDLDENGQPADAVDVTMMIQASVGDIIL